MKENQKISKIASEFSMYLLEFGMKNIQMNINKTKEKITICFESDIVNQEILIDMKKQLTSKRNSAFELYGWELIGNADDDNELGLIGKLIDEFDYQVEKGKVTFKMVRYEN